MFSTCTNCGSPKIIPTVRVLDEGLGSTGFLEVVVEGNPGASVFKDPVRAMLVADICGECGHTELRATEPERLYQAYLRYKGL